MMKLPVWLRVVFALLAMVAIPILLFPIAIMGMSEPLPSSDGRMHTPESWRILTFCLLAAATFAGWFSTSFWCSVFTRSEIQSGSIKSGSSSGAILFFAGLFMIFIDIILFSQMLSMAKLGASFGSAFIPFVFLWFVGPPLSFIGLRRGVWRDIRQLLGGYGNQN